MRRMTTNCDIVGFFSVRGVKLVCVSDLFGVKRKGDGDQRRALEIKLSPLERHG